MNKHQQHIQYPVRQKSHRQQQRRRLVMVFVLAAFALASYYVSSPPPTQAQLTPSANIVISQVYVGGGNAGATYTHDFVELYNRGNTSVDISGWSIQVATASGTTWTVLNISTALQGGRSTVIAPGKYFLIRMNSSGTPVGSVALPDFDASNTGVNMANTGGGKVALVTDTTALTGSCPQTDAQTTRIRDFVGYGTADCSETAPAPLPANNASIIRKSSVAGIAGTTGCQDTNNNLADFQTTSPPSPRSSLTTAAVCGVGEFSISVDNTGQGCDFSVLGGLPARTFTWSHTLGGGDSQALVVGVSTYSTLAVLPLVRVTGVRIVETNQALTRVDDGLGVSSDSKAGVDMFIIKEPLPAPGTYTIEVSLGAGVEYAVGGSVSFNGVNQTTPNRAFVAATNRATGTSTNPAITTVPSASNEIVVDTVSTAFGTPPNILTPNASQTERWNGKFCDGPPPANEPDLTLNSIGAGSTKPGSATTTMSWTQNNSQPWVIEAISLVPLAPTEVKVASFEAAETGTGVLLRWQTGYEVNNLGFNLYREQKGRRTRLNPTPLAGSALLAGQHTRLTAGQSYSWLDRSTKNREGVQYWLEDIDLAGKRTVHGPVTIAAGESIRAADEEQAMLLSQLSQSPASNAAFVRGYPALKTHAPAPSSSNSTQAATPAPLTGKRRLIGKVLLLSEKLIEAAETGNAVSSGERQSIAQNIALERQRTLAGGAAGKIAVRRAGWYRLAQAELLAAGINPNADPSLLQLYADGVEQAVLQKGSRNQFGADTAIEFYGTGMDTRTSDTRTYWLVVGTQPGKRVNSQNNQSNAATNAKDTDVNWTTPATGPTAKPQPAVSLVKPAATHPAPAGIRPAVPGVILLLPRDTTNAATTTATTTPAPSSSAAEERASGDAASAKSKKKALRKKNKRKLRQGLHHGRIAQDDSQILAEPSSQGFDFTLERKERTVYFSALLNGDEDNFFGPVITATPVKQVFNLNGIDATSSGPATLEVSLQGGTVQAHQVRVAFNGSELGVMSFADQTRAVQQFQIPRSALTQGESTVTLTALGGDGDVNVVDYVRLTYRHAYRAENDQLTFTSEHTSPVTVDGFTNAQIKVFDITRPDDVVQLNVKVSPKGAGYAVKIPGGQGTLRTLLAIADNQARLPEAISLNEPSTLSLGSNRADFVILTHRDFRDAVKPLADLRRSQGMDVAVVTIEDVYDEFSYGAPSRQAVSDFFSWARSNWNIAPDYALLVGDASSDPRNYLGTNRPDYVPTGMLDTRRMETASDDALVDFDNDGIADLALGRLPVQTVAQAEKVIGKITGYVPGQSGYGALLVSDHFEDYDFEAANQSIRALLPSNMPVTTVNRRDSSAEQVRSDIVAGINQGPQLVNYAGHGSVEVWTGAGILRSTDKSSLTNGNKLPVVVTMTCLNGFFQDVFTESLAEALIRAEGGGAVAVWASSGLTEPDRQALIDQQLISLLFGNEQSLALGDAVRAAKAATADMDVRRTWILFGDPTMRIR
jgi:hypothetical protein